LQTTLGQRIRKVYEDSEMNQNKFAETIGVHLKSCKSHGFCFFIELVRLAKGLNLYQNDKKRNNYGTEKIYWC